MTKSYLSIFFLAFTLFILGAGAVNAYCANSSVVYIDVVHDGSFSTCPITVDPGDSAVIWYKYIDAGEGSSYKYDSRTLFKDDSQISCTTTQGVDDCGEKWSNFSVTFPSTPGSYVYKVGAYASSSSGGSCGSTEGLTQSCAVTVSPPPAISVSPTSKNYGNVDIGSTSDQVFTVTNSGGGTLSGTVTFPSVPFSCSGDCTASYSLGAGSSRTYTIRFSPTVAGAASGTMSFTGGGGATVSLSGTGTVPPAFSLSPNDFSFDYGNVNVGGNDTRVYTVTNSGGGNLIGGVSVSGAGFSCTGVCDGYNLSAGSSKSYTIRFAPDSAGAKSGSVQFTSAPGRTVSLSGTGFVPTLTFPSGSWHRIWYSTSGASPAFSSANFLGEGAGSNDMNGNSPNVASEAFTTDWQGNSVAFGWSNTVGFTSGRTINVPADNLYRFTVGADDGIRLYVSDADNVLQLQDGCTNWADHGYATQTCDVFLSAGNHKVQLDYYENGGTAKVSFTPAMYFQTSTTELRQGDPVTLTASCLGSCEGRVVSFQIYSATQPPNPAFAVASCTISGGTCSIQYTRNGSSDETLSLWALVDINSNSTWNPEDKSNVIAITWTVCQKTPARRSDSITVPLVGGGTCAVTIEHLGRDDSDSGAENNVSYETLESDLNGAFPDSRKLGMDDNPGGCQNNLQFTNEWTPPESGALSVKSTKNDYNAGHDLEYGYKLTASNSCTIISAVRETCDRGPSSTCQDPTITSPTKIIELAQPWWPSISDIVTSAQHRYTIVPDTAPTITEVGDFGTLPDQEWHNSNPVVNVNFQDDFGLNNGFYQIDCPLGICDPDTWLPLFTNHSGTSYNTAGFSFSIPEGVHRIYFKSDDDAGHDYSFYSEVKKDTLPPIPTPTIAMPPASGYRASDNEYWFKAGNYNITIVDNDDTTPGVGNYSDLDTSSCFYRIWDLGTGDATSLTSRSCTSFIPLRVGIGLDCVTENLERCQLELWSRDRARNWRIFTRNLNVDRTAPSAQ